MNNHMEQAAKAAKKPPTNEATAGLSSASDIGPYPNFGVAVHGRDEGFRFTRPFAAGDPEDGSPAEVSETYIHSSCSDSEQPSIDILKGGSDSPHENFDHLTMSKETVVLPVSEGGGLSAPTGLKGSVIGACSKARHSPRPSLMV